LCIKDAEGRFLYCNRTMMKSMGCEEISEEEIRGKHMKDLFIKHWEKYYTDDLKVISRGEPLLGIIEPFEPDGTPLKKFVRTDKYPLRNNDGDICGIIVLIQDITNIVEKENEYRELLNSQTLKFAQMNNELKGHLNVFPLILSALEQIDTSKLDPLNHQYIAIARKNTNLTYQFLHKFIDSYTQNQTSQIQQFNFISLLIDCTAILTENATNRLITLSLQSDPSEEQIILTGNITKVRAVILRLISIGIGIFNSSDIVLKINNMENKIRLDVVIQQDKCEPPDRVHKDYQQFIALNAMIRELGGNLISHSSPQKGTYNCSLELPKS